MVSVYISNIRSGGPWDRANHWWAFSCLGYQVQHATKAHNLAPNLNSNRNKQQKGAAC
jgi:hypothetical protein